MRNRYLDSIETTDTYKNLGTLYFKKSTTLSVLAHIDGSHWEVYLNEHRETNYHGKTIHNSSTVTKTGTYYARLKEYNGFTKKWRKKDSKSIKVVKDSTAPEAYSV
ncbi:MAG: hypothetical protein B6229_02890 [Spirochaetaceae bacterium 4572_7]|nr:MAG: hypothetical protein B6229_02890 [Spirochaetaceae bacterium 4572_7]